MDYITYPVEVVSDYFWWALGYETNEEPAADGQSKPAYGEKKKEAPLKIEGQSKLSELPADEKPKLVSPKKPASVGRRPTNHRLVLKKESSPSIDNISGWDLVEDSDGSQQKSTPTTPTTPTTTTTTRKPTTPLGGMGRSPMGGMMMPAFDPAAAKKRLKPTSP